MPELDRYAVFGNPIGHSKSPAIHTAFAQETGQYLDYQAQLVPRGFFPDSVTAFWAQGGKGLNVTVPFKEEAFSLANELSPRAVQARAVNTLISLGNNRCYGDNTDGVGLERDLIQNWGLSLTGRRLLVLGAGGAARGILGPLLATNPAILTLANRTPDRAQELVEAFKPFATVPLSGGSFSDLLGQSFDLVINATSASLENEVPPLPDDLLAPGAWCYDLMYRATPTPFLVWATAHGAAGTADGLGMLVEQAAEAFWLWRGVRPDTVSVIARLRESLHS